MAQEALAQRLADVDRLVLLGDIVELREGPVRDALAAASGVLSAVVQAYGPGREVVVVPGNHDHHLLSGWFARRSAAGPPEPLGLESAVDTWGEEPLAQLIAALGAGGAAVRVAYPGVWLRDDVYATHGHYLDRHTTVPMFERLGAGAMARILRRPTSDARRAEDYEAVLTPIYAWIHAVAQTGGPVRAAQANGAGASTHVWQSLGQGFRRGGMRRRALVAGVGGGIAAINRLGLGPVKADLSVTELRRAGLSAMGAVTAQLEIGAAHVIFGHTHRAGPLPHDDRSEWRSARGAGQLHNCGCWVHEPAFLGSRPGDSPYRAGFAIELDGDEPPRLVQVLDQAVTPS